MKVSKLFTRSASRRLPLKQLAISCGLVLGAIGLAGAAVVCVPPPSGKLLWLPGDGNTNDITGNGNNGTSVGGASFGTGEVGQAFSFNGSAQYLTIPDSPGLHPSSLTAEGWFMMQAQGQQTSFISKATGATSADSFSLYYLNGLQAQICSDDNDQFSCSTITTTKSPAVGKWFYLAMTYDSANQVEVLYYNGAQIGTLGGVLPPFYGNQPLTIGADIESLSPAYFLYGGADEVTLYDRALSATEIQNIYAASSGGKCKNQACDTPPPGMVSWYKGDGDFSDSQGGNDAAGGNGASFRAGEVGQGFALNGTNQFVGAFPGAALRLTSFTAEGWFMEHAGGVALIAKPGSTSADSFALYTEGSGNLASQICSVDDNQNACFTPGSGVTVQPDVWFHAAMTYDGPSQTLQMYYNGVKAGSPVTGVPGPFYSANPLVIGADVDNGVIDQFLSGGADEVAIFNRALTPTEIAEIYKAGSHGKCSNCASLKAQPLAWYKGEANTLDDSGNSYNGALQGIVTYARGIVGQGFSFGGGSMQVNSSVPGNFGTSDFAMDFWMKQDTTPLQSVISKRAACGADPGFDVRSNAVDLERGSQVQGLIVELQPQTASTGFHLDDAASLADGAFHHVVIERAGDVASLYVDGVLVDSGKGAHSLNINSTAPLALSGSPCIGSGGNNPFSGVIDEVQVFNRALSASEINGLYCAGGHGTCGPVLTATPNPVAFGVLAQNNTKELTDKVSISGAGFTFGASTLSGPNAADFSIDPSSTVTTCTGTKAAGLSCSVGVRFTPSQAPGTSESATLNLNDPSGTPRLTVALSGTSSTSITVSPSPVNFGTVKVGSSLQKIVTVTNRESQPISFDATFIGTEYSIASNPCGGTMVKPGAACRVTVKFAPTTPGAAGGVLRLTDSPDSTSPHDVTLSGTGS